MSNTFFNKMKLKTNKNFHWYVYQKVFKCQFCLYKECTKNLQITPYEKAMHLNMISLVLSGKIIFPFFRKYDLILYKKNERCFVRKYNEMIWYFLYFCITVINMTLLSSTKKSKTIFSWENTLKGDWHSRLMF